MSGKHEVSDLNPKYVVYFAIALVVVGAMAYLGVWWMFRQLQREQAQAEPAPVQVTAPSPLPATEPRLQISPQGDLEELRRQENAVLSTYRWIDREKGVARIPIDRAMKVFIERQKR